MPNNSKKTKSTGIYWDSSALIKRYIEEDNSEITIELFKSHSRHFTSVITHAEILCTTQRLKREGLLTLRELEKINQSFFDDWDKFAKVNYESTIQAIASEVIKTSALRGADLIHLASSLSLKRNGLNIIFATFDKRLMNAAIDHGMDVSSH